MSKKIISLLFSLLLVCSMTAALAQIEVTDTVGRHITLEAPASRIAALTPADCEILYALGAGDALIGRGEYCDYPEDVLALPVVQSGEQTNIEEILALSPQVVLMGAGFDTRAQSEILARSGVAAVATGADSIEETYEIIRLIGALVGRDEQAETLIGEMQQVFAWIAEAGEGAKQDGKTVYFEISPLQYGLYTAGANTFMDELTALCGMENAFADVQGWASVSEEQVLLRDPDYIVTTTMHYGVGPAPDEEIMSRAGWGGLKAVKVGRILCADSNIFSRPGPRLVQAAQLLRDFLYGEGM